MQQSSSREFLRVPPLETPPPKLRFDNKIAKKILAVLLSLYILNYIYRSKYTPQAEIIQPCKREQPENLMNHGKTQRNQLRQLADFHLMAKQQIKSIESTAVGITPNCRNLNQEFLDGNTEELRSFSKMSLSYV